MGYQVGVTPLQMAAAVSSIANGGELLKPRVVRAVIRDGRRVPVPRTAVQRTMAPNVAAELTTIMEAVVERGTATGAQLEGHTIAGKTGTARKVIDGRYSASEYNASFVGFLPSRNPVFTVVVVIDSPHGRNGYYGGTVAAPIFRSIAEAALRRYAVPPSINPAPPVLVARHEDAREQPTSGPSEPLAIVTLGGTAQPVASIVPDLRGLSAREALRTLAQLGVTARLRGTGNVVDQEPGPGTVLDRGAVTTLWLDREPTVIGAAHGARP
jgi:membrane peptidoglycan carboxypeptidase